MWERFDTLIEVCKHVCQTDKINSDTCNSFRELQQTKKYRLKVLICRY